MGAQKWLTDSKRAEQETFSYSALKFFVLVFSATILRPLTSAKNYATIADRKSANSRDYFNLTMIPKKSREKNNTNSDFTPSEFVLFRFGTPGGNRTPN